MIIDAHHHLWDLTVRDQAWITGAEVAPIRRSFGVADLAAVTGPAGVGAGVLVQTVTVAAETPELLAQAEQHDLIAAVVGWVDLTAPSVADDLAALAGGAGGRWLRGIRRLAAQDNVVCKLSGLVTEADWASWRVGDLAPYVEVVLEAFGPRRLAFGSDWPVCLLAASYADVLAAARELTAGLSPAEHEEVFAGTARRTYRLAR